MSILRISLYISVILSGASQLQAQKVWTLPECIDYAQKNNLQVKQNVLNIELNKIKLEQSVAGLVPNLNGQATHYYNYGRTIDQYTNQFVDQRTQSNNFALSSSVILFEGFQLQNTIRQNNYDYKASQYDEQKGRNDLSLNVVTAYVQILFNRELVSVRKGQLDASKAQVERTRKLVESGSLAKASLLDAESQAANEELLLINAQNQLEISTLALAQLLDLPSAKGFDIQTPELPLPTENLLQNNPEEIYNSALKTMPEIKSAEMKIKSAEKSIAAARGGRSPRLTLGGSLGTGYSDIRNNTIVTGFQNIVVAHTANGEDVIQTLPVYGLEKIPFKQQLTDNYNKSIGFSLTIPLMNGWQTQAGINRAKITKASADLNDQMIRLQLNKAIQQSYVDANASLKKYYATEKALESLREAFRYTEQKFNVGLLNALDYLTAKNNQNRAESDLLQAKYDFIFKSKVLDFYMGKPLTF